MRAFVCVCLYVCVFVCGERERERCGWVEKKIFEELHVCMNAQRHGVMYVQQEE